VANPLRTTSKRALVPVEQLPAHGRATPLRAPKVRNPEELAIGAKQIAPFGVHIYVTHTEIDVVAAGSTNVEQML
jgi:hypothetical protein